MPIAEVAVVGTHEGETISRCFVITFVTYALTDKRFSPSLAVVDC